MARLRYRVAVDRVQATSGTPLLSASGATVVVYLDAAGTQVANDLLDVAGATVVTGTLQLGNASELEFSGPPAGQERLWVRVDGGGPTPVDALAADLVTQALAEADEVARATYVGKGDRVYTGERPLPGPAVDPSEFVKLQSSHDDSSAGMVIWAQKVDGDSDDVNVDGAIMVKHGKDYAATPGYADTFQVYTLAGSDGTIIGNNDFVGVTDSPYAPVPADVPCGYVRFELGPLWPYSEVARFNNRGDLIIGWALVRKTSCSQTGTTITGTGADFQPSDVGKFLVWGDYETGGKRAFADRITGYTGPGQVTVETSRTIANQAARVCTPKTIITKDGEVQKYAAPTVYTPTVRGSGSNPGLGTTGLVQFGRYFDDGNRVRGDVRIKFGTGFSAGSGFYSVTLPVLAHADDIAQNTLVGQATFYDLSANANYVLAAAVLSTDSVIFYVNAATSPFGAATPVVPAAGDEIRLHFDYRRAV
jgi:hypothetical protein